MGRRALARGKEKESGIGLARDQCQQAFLLLQPDFFGREPGQQVPSSSSLWTGRQLDKCAAEKTTSAPQLHPSQATTEEAFRDCSEFTLLYES
ncbi:hypothetical protein NQZ68_032234 [Dissostichus eleginoides]|nr:hypothetical protein NQZ68_032234 [Dissostichus eleginoides]